MSNRGRAGGVLLALAYLLTIGLVDLGHQHGPCADEAARCAATCRAPGAHLSGHKSPDLTKSDRDCPACQHRGAKVVAHEPRGEARVPLVRPHARREPPALTRLSSHASTIRGPPTPSCASA